MYNNHIPSTPKPKPIDDIQEQARDRFGGIIICDKNDNDYGIENFFIEYDHYELYNEKKSYSKRPYQAAYKGVIKDYQNYLYIIDNIDNEDNENDDNKQYYVVAKKIYNDLESLEKYCTCLKCSASYFNPLKYIWCSHCTNCIKSGKGFAKEEYIKLAREIKNNTNNEPHKFKRYLNNINILKSSEIFILIIFLLWIFF